MLCVCVVHRIALHWPSAPSFDFASPSRSQLAWLRKGKPHGPRCWLRCTAWVDLRASAIVPWRHREASGFSTTWWAHRHFPPSRSLDGLAVALLAADRVACAHSLRQFASDAIAQALRPRLTFPADVPAEDIVHTYPQMLVL